MGLYADRVVPRLVELTCGQAGLVRFREAAMAGLTGRVLELGFGSGTNVAHYPEAVAEVLAVEPSDLAWEMSAKRRAASALPIERVGLDGQAIDLDDASCDAALVTFALCTIPDPGRALSEAARIVRPGGRIHLLEHGIAPDARVARWQRRIDPIERRIADGCELSRDPVGLLEQGGWRIERMEQRYVRGPKPWSYLTIAEALRP